MLLALMGQSLCDNISPMHGNYLRLQLYELGHAMARLRPRFEQFC
jgi:hypothetical protein